MLFAFTGIRRMPNGRFKVATLGVPGGPGKLYSGSLRAATRFVVPPGQPRHGFESLGEAQEFERNIDEKTEMARIATMKGAACDAAFDTTLL